MGWTPQHLWDATLPEFLLAWRGYQEQQKRADFRAGQIAQILANSNRDPKKTPDPWTAGDFFPSLLTPAEQRERTARTKRNVIWSVEGYTEDEDD